jgi:hypothetical protein
LCPASAGNAEIVLAEQFNIPYEKFALEEAEVKFAAERDSLGAEVRVHTRRAFILHNGTTRKANLVPGRDGRDQDWIEDMLKDILYLRQMKRLEKPQNRKEKILDIVPVTGLIVGRFYRLENELRFVVVVVVISLSPPLSYITLTCGMVWSWRVTERCWMCGETIFPSRRRSSRSSSPPCLTPPPLLWPCGMQYTTHNVHAALVAVSVIADSALRVLSVSLWCVWPHRESAALNVIRGDCGEGSKGKERLSRDMTPVGSLSDGPSPSPPAAEAKEAKPNTSPPATTAAPVTAPTPAVQENGYVLPLLPLARKRASALFITGLSYLVRLSSEVSEILPHHQRRRPHHRHHLVRRPRHRRPRSAPSLLFRSETDPSPCGTAPALLCVCSVAELTPPAESPVLTDCIVWGRRLGASLGSRADEIKREG